MKLIDFGIAKAISSDTTRVSRDELVCVFKNIRVCILLILDAVGYYKLYVT